MESLLINTTPQQRQLYAIKKHEGEAFPLPFHTHERFELTYIIKGNGTRIIGDNVTQYESGDVVLVAPHIPHQWQSSWLGEKAVSAITFFFSKEFPSKEFQLLPEFKAIADLLEASKFGIALKGKLRRNIANQITKLPSEYNLDAIMQILSILSEIGKSGEYTILMDKGYSIPRKQDQERINKLVNHIRQNISRKISISELAGVAFMHPGSVNRFFKRSTGFSLVEYINLMRIGLACQLLSESQKSILGISMECGFNNLSNFNRTFKRVKKITPKEYRNQFQ